MSLGESEGQGRPSNSVARMWVSTSSGTSHGFPDNESPMQILRKIGLEIRISKIRIPRAGWEMRDERQDER